MLKNRRRQEKTIVGLEMDPSHLAAAQVAVNGRISVTKGAVATLRPGILRDGEVVDPVALTEALRTLFAEHELPTQVRLGIMREWLKRSRIRTGVRDAHCGARPVHRIGDNALDLRVIVGRIGLMPGTEVKYASVAAIPCAPTAENFTSGEPGEKD